MNLKRLFLRGALLLLGCTASATRTPLSALEPTVAIQADAPDLRSEAQAVVAAIVAEVNRVRGAPPADVPTVEVRNTPQLIFFSRKANQIVVPSWADAPPGIRAVFATFAGGGDAEAERFFRLFFNRFLIAHEAGHWFQAHVNQREATLYENENAANRFAVAFWRTRPDGERFLAELERLATRAAANLSDPTPAGDDPVAYFNANYQALGRDPIKYGYYQFRFMRDALRDRARIDFASMVAGAQGE